ncbi:MAG TPA: hypothetical protein VES66_02880 [Terriglobales bacterium]|nr:hypothetical protein [Terriglobales bacterium]
MKNMTASAKLFIGAMVAAGLAALVGGLTRWECKDPVRFLSFLVIAAIASRLKVKLPGANGNLSVNLPFILIAVAELSFPEAVLIAAVSAFVQGLPGRGRSLKPVQALFNVSTLIVAVGTAELAYKRGALIPDLAAESLLIALAGVAFLVADTLPVAAVISLTENLNLGKLWGDMLALTFSYFAMSTGIAAIAVTASHYVGWLTPLVVLPVMIASYVSYRRYFRFPAAAALANLQFATLPAGAREKAEVKHF